MTNLDTLDQNLRCSNSFNNTPWLTHSLAEAEANAETAKQPELQEPEGGGLGVGLSPIQASAAMEAGVRAQRTTPAKIAVAGNSAPSLAPDLDDLALDATFEITLLTTDDLLSKEIGLNDDGTLAKGKSGYIVHGRAERRIFIGMTALAAMLSTLPGYCGIALGTLKDDLPEEVELAPIMQRFDGYAAHASAPA